VLIDYQKDMFEVIRSETDAAMVEPAREASGQDRQGARHADRAVDRGGWARVQRSDASPRSWAELEGVEPIDRSSMNAFEDDAFREAVKATGRKRLIIGGLHTEICLTFATVQALKDGYDPMFVTDAVGGRSQIAHRTAIERLSHAGAVPTTALAVNTELFRDWASPAAGPAGDVIYWYFREAPKLTAAVGVADAEKQAAAAALQGAT